MKDKTFFSDTYEQGHMWDYKADPKKPFLFTKYDYCIDAEDFEENTLDWLLHLGGKSWFTAKSLESLMNAYEKHRQISK